MRIALITTCLEVGGAERVVTSLADSFVQRGHEVLIVFLTGEAIILPKDKKVRVVGLGLNSFGTLFSAYVRLRGLLAAFRPDVVHSHLFHSNILARLIRISLRVPLLISSVHNTVEGGRLRMLAYRLTDGLTDISTNVSHEAVSSFVEKKAVNENRMVAIHNGISTEEFRFCGAARAELRRALGIDKDCKLIVAVGKLSEQKDYPNLFNALKRLDPETVRFQAFVVGEGPLKVELEDKIDSLGLRDRVRLLGVRHDVPRLMSAADVFVLPSAWEGFGLVVAEAMACQRVVVATDCGGVKEVLGDAGYLVPPRQAKGLRDALHAALNLSAIDSAEMGRKARRRVQELYSIEAAVDKWLNLYTRS